MNVLEKINDVGNKLSEQKWDELTKSLREYCNQIL